MKMTSAMYSNPHKMKENKLSSYRVILIPPSNTNNKATIAITIRMFFFNKKRELAGNINYIS